MLVFTLKEKGGLNHVIFLLLFLFSLFLVCLLLSLLLYFSSSLKPLLLSACSMCFLQHQKYPGYMKYLLYVYWLLWVDILKYSVDGLNVYCCKLFHCLVFDTVGMYYLSNPNVHQENLLSFKFVLKIWIICFLLRSISGPEEFCNMPSQSSRYKPTFSFLITVFNKCRM